MARRSLQKAGRRILGVRAATMVEYALMIVAIMLLAATAFRTLGKAARKNADESGSELLKRSDG